MSEKIRFMEKMKINSKISESNSKLEMFDGIESVKHKKIKIKKLEKWNYSM
jgi:hypothetical protein